MNQNSLRRFRGRYPMQSAHLFPQRRCLEIKAASSTRTHTCYGAILVASVLAEACLSMLSGASHTSKPSQGVAKLSHADHAEETQQLDGPNAICVYAFDTVKVSDRGQCSSCACRKESSPQGRFTQACFKAMLAADSLETCLSI